MVSENVIHTLGKLGVAFIDDGSTSEDILQVLPFIFFLLHINNQIFLQRFSNPPSQQDNLIIVSLADMWIAGAVCVFLLTKLFYYFLLKNSIHDRTMKLFTRITIESSSRVYSPEPTSDSRYLFVFFFKIFSKGGG